MNATYISQLLFVPQCGCNRIDLGPRVLVLQSKDNNLLRLIVVKINLYFGDIKLFTIS